MQRLQSRLLDGFEQRERDHKLRTFNFILVRFTAFPINNDPTMAIHTGLSN